MEVPLGETSVKTACRIVNELRQKDSDTDYGWLGDPTWEYSSYSRYEHITLHIKFESWKLGKDQFDNLLGFIESLDPIVDLDYYLSDDSPLVFTLKIDQDEALQQEKPENKIEKSICNNESGFGSCGHVFYIKIKDDEEPEDIHCPSCGEQGYVEFRSKSTENDIMGDTQS